MNDDMNFDKNLVVRCNKDLMREGEFDRDFVLDTLSRIICYNVELGYNRILKSCKEVCLDYLGLIIIDYDNKRYYVHYEDVDDCIYDVFISEDADKFIKYKRLHTIDSDLIGMLKREFKIKKDGFGEYYDYVISNSVVLK